MANWSRRHETRAVLGWRLQVRWWMDWTAVVIAYTKRSRSKGIAPPAILHARRADGDPNRAVSWTSNGRSAERMANVRLPHGEAVDGAQVYDPRASRRAQKRAALDLTKRGSKPKSTSEFRFSRRPYRRSSAVLFRMTIHRHD